MLNLPSLPGEMIIQTNEGFSAFDCQPAEFSYLSHERQFHG